MTDTAVGEGYLRSDLRGLAPYGSEGGGAACPVKLDANEPPRDLPPAIKERILTRLRELPFNRYPEASGLALRQAIAVAHGLSPEMVQLGCGSSEILQALCLALAGPGRAVVYPTPSFSMYPTYAAVAGSRAVPVPLGADFAFSPADVVAAARQAGPGVVLLCNPNNPTGQAVPLAAIEAVVAAVDAPVVVDEAYYEFHGETALPLLARYPHLVVTRTFSKAYGLAGARVGYMLAQPALCQAVARVLLPYHVNALSLAAAEAVFVDQPVMQAAVAEITAQRQRLAEALAALPNCTVYPSRTNFLLVRVPDAAAVAVQLAARGVAVRTFAGVPSLAGCLRITVGSAAENDRLLRLWRDLAGR